MSGRRMLTALVCAFLVLAIAGCGGDDDSTSSSPQPTSAETTTTTEGTAPAEGAEAPGTKPKVTVPSGPPPKKLEKKDLVEGSGAEAKAATKSPSSTSASAMTAAKSSTHPGTAANRSPSRSAPAK